MKKLRALLILSIAIVSLVGCEDNESSKSENITADNFVKVDIEQLENSETAESENNTQEETSGELEQEETEAPIENENTKPNGLVAYKSEDKIDLEAKKVIDVYERTVADLTGYEVYKAPDKEIEYNIKDYSQGVKIIIYNMGDKREPLFKMVTDMCERLRFDKAELQTNGAVTFDENFEYKEICLFNDKYLFYIAIEEMGDTIKYKLVER